jgi:type IV pilus assembly protein PilE
MHPRPRTHSGKQLGFTLIEMMIAVVVVALLASVALPSFFDSLRKSRRAEAFTTIASVQQAQERWRGNNTDYSDSLTTLGQPTTTSGGQYTIALAGASGTGYTVSAIAVAGTSQAKDRACLKMAVRVSGGQITYAGCEACSLEATDFSATNVCWSR